MELQIRVQIVLCCRREREELLESKGDFYVRHSNETDESVVVWRVEASI